MTAVLPLETTLPIRHEIPSEVPAVEEVGQSSSVAVAWFLGELIFDVLAGRRSPHRIRGHLSKQVASLLLTTRLHVAQGPDFRLRSVHACLVTGFAVEACLIVGTQHRVRALALRIEQDTGGSWVCTQLSPV